MGVRDFDIKPPFSIPEVATLAKRMKVDFSKEKFTLEALHKGMAHELEHSDLTHGDASETAAIALVHLREDPEIYEKLDLIEANAEDGKAEELSNEEFSKLISKEVYDAMKDATATKLMSEIVRVSNSMDAAGLFKSADRLDMRAEIVTAGIIDDIRQKMENARKHIGDKYNIDKQPPGGAAPPVKAPVKKLPVGVRIESFANPEMEYTFKKNVDVDNAIKKRLITIDAVLNGVITMLSEAGEKASIARITAAPFATRYNVARAVANEHGLLQ